MARDKATTSFADEMIRDMEDLVATMAAGGSAAVAKRFTVRRVKMPGVPAVAPDKLKATREALGVSQPVFAAFLGVSSQLVKAWEQGKQQPTPPTRRLLLDMNDNPEHWLVRIRQEAKAKTSRSSKVRKGTRPPARPQ